MPNVRPRGRPRRYAQYEQLERSLPARMSKRPIYCDGIGLFRGAKSFTVWIKIRMPRGGAYKGRHIAPGGALEIKLGNRASWGWAELERERDRLQGLADRGEPLEEAKQPTFAAHADDWLSRKQSTAKGYDVLKSHVERHLKPTFGTSLLSQIGLADINRWVARQREHAKPATVQRQLSTFRAIMNDARRSGIIAHNPICDADPIKGVESRERFLTQAEWETVLNTADAIEVEQEGHKEKTPQQKRGWLRHFVDWAYHSGMRRSEILNLTFRDLRELENSMVVVEVTNTKGGKPRHVTCTQQMIAIANQLKQLERDDGDDRLFPISLTTLKRSLGTLWKRTGLQDVRLHDLRRTHATMLIQRNIDPRTVAARLGHRGTDMLAKHYAINLGDIAAARVFDPKMEQKEG